MSKGILVALIMVGLAMIVLIANSRGGLNSGVSVDLVFQTVRGLKSVVFLVFMAWGVAIGVLLK